MVPRDRHDRRAEPGEAGHDPRLVAGSALREVADEEDGLPAREPLEGGQDEAVRVQVRGDDDRPVDRRGLLGPFAGDGDQLREPLDGVAVRVVVTLPGGQHALRELQEAGQLLPVGVEGRLAQRPVVEAADADADEDDGGKCDGEPRGRPEQEPATAGEDGDQRAADEPAHETAEERERSRSAQAVGDCVVQLAFQARQACVRAAAGAERRQRGGAVERAELELDRKGSCVRLGPHAPVDDRDVDVHLSAPCRRHVDVHGAERHGPRLGGSGAERDDAPR